MGKGTFRNAIALFAGMLVLSALLVAAPAAQAGLPRLKAVPDPVDGGRIVDSKGREVILRGVNVNSLGHYWQGSGKPATLPLEREDPARIARIGWNLVRLIVSWSRVQPEPGRINYPYLKRVRAWVDRFESRGIYTVIDFHQDAWGPTLAARPGEACVDPAQPAFGWDGAPGWATFDDGQPRCFTSNREVNPAVRAAWRNFFNDRPASDGTGIQTHYVRMLGSVARMFARDTAVAGIDIMNEPNAFGPVENQAMSDFYERALKKIRQGEEKGRGFPHLVLFEPSVLWSLTGSGAPAPFGYDSGVVYSPHLYGGSIGSMGPPSRTSFENARTEAAQFGGAPVLTGEWGGDPLRATGEGRGYFARHQKLQDEFGFGAALWTWKQSCGDPHAATNDPEVAPPLPPWSVYRMDCEGSSNRILGTFGKLVRDLRRGFVRRAPGKLESMSFDPASSTLSASGRIAGRSTTGPLEIYLPGSLDHLKLKGLDRPEWKKLGPGTLVWLTPEGRRWQVTASSR